MVLFLEIRSFDGEVHKSNIGNVYCVEKAKVA